MARRARNCPAGYVYHVLNRSAGRIALFRKEGDYAAMERILVAAKARVDLPLLAWCFMKNHWHFVVRPETDTQVTDFFRWLTHTHAMRWRVAHRTVGYGHLYQGRFKSFPVQSDEHLLTVLRYVERNALGAGLVPRAEQWRWSGLWARLHGGDAIQAILSPWPVKRPTNWTDRVNAVLSAQELKRLKLSLDRGRPFGADEWVEQMARELRLEHTVRPEGRPPKQKN